MKLSYERLEKRYNREKKIRKSAEYLSDKNARENYETRKQLEISAEKLKAALQVAEGADRAKSEFLANISHEIRTPMNGVMGMAELLAKTELDSKQTMYTDVIVKSGTSLLTIINDILDFSKIDAGQMELDPAPFKFSEAIEDVATLISSKVAEKDLELIIRIDPDLPDILVGDVGRIRQIVTNLMGNAVKFTEQGHVYVNVTGAVEENDGERAAKIKVSVADTGIGIPADDVENVFDKFSQADTSATRKHEGTGLGLSITSSLVQLMGGEIGVESELGSGSTFWFEITLPIHGEQLKKKRAPIDLSGSRILVVDDNHVNRSILLEQMSSWKFDSAAAESGSEALNLMRAAHERNIKIDCVILDYQMPEMSGGATVKAMQADEKLKDIPVIMLTSVDQTEDGKTFSSLGIQAQLTKPARSSLLLETIIHVLQENNGAIIDDSQEDGKKSEVVDEFTEELENEPSKATSKNITINNNEIDILVCEDNEVNQIVFTQILNDSGYRFRVANNGKEGVSLYKHLQPKIIIMDVSMPVMNGLEATIAVREIENSSELHTPIIGATAHAIKGDMEKCLDAGMDDYLSKPISPDALVQKIENWMKKAYGRRKTDKEFSGPQKCA
ncbi:MAG: response regulator [Rhizobiaceae bacterium]